LALEIWANDATATVTSGGTTAPAAGTVESWTLSGSTLPAVSSGSTQCYVADTAPSAELEKILVTNISGATATVTRGADGTTPVAHAPGFQAKQVLTHASLVALQTLSGDVTGTTGATAVGKIQGVAVTTAEADLVADLNNATARSATATLLPGEETIFSGSTASQTLTLPASPPSSSVNTITNAATVSVTLAPGAGATLSNFGAAGNITIPAGYTFAVVYIGTTWYVQSAGPSDFAKSGALGIANGGTGQVTQQAALNALAGSVTAAEFLRGNGSNVQMSAIQAADLPAATTGTQGAVIIDGTAADIAAPGTQAAGSVGKAADAGHVHPVPLWLPADQGMLWAVADPWASNQHFTLTAGTLYLVKIPARTQLVVTKLWWLCFSAASGTSTGSFTGLYSSSGTLLSGSSDVGSLLTNAAQLSLTTPQTLSAGSFGWAALLVNTPTMPSVQAGIPAASLANAGLTASTARWATNGTGLTALPGTITPSSNALSSDTFWVGVS
jgi:hypothetical protein